MAKDHKTAVTIHLENFEPKELYKNFERRLRNELPADQQEFIKLLEREGIIGEKNKRKMNAPNQIKAVRLGVILQEIEASLSDSDEKFYKLLKVMREYNHGLETLVQKIENYLNPAGGYFDCEVMDEFMYKNNFALWELPCNQIKLELVSHGVISYEDKRSMNHQSSQHQTTVVLKNIHECLYNKQPKKLKSFLQVMEGSGVPLLEDTAKRLGGSKRVPDTTPEAQSKEFIEKYLKAKCDLGFEKLKLLKILFFGPAGAGKTTLLSVLLQQHFKSLRESTGILDQKLVQFKVAVQTDTTKSISRWKVVSIDEEILRLRYAIEKNIEKHTEKDKSEDFPLLKNWLNPFSYKSLQPNMKIDEKLQTAIDNISTDKSEISENKNENDTFEMNLQQFTVSDTLIACYDSGGQPGIFDVMPVLATVTTGNVMVFDMSKDLNLPCDSNYFREGKRWGSSDIKTHYTTAQLMKTALANIQPYIMPYSSGSANEICVNNSQLLVVGTHLDLCGDTEEEVCERLLETERIICNDILPECSNLSIIERHKNKNTRLIHPIANKCDEDAVKDREEAAQEIRTAIENMSSTDSINKEVPISWLLFYYEIKLQSDGPYILRSDCDEIAEKSYIKQEDVDDVLFFFHELGVMLHYKNIKNLKHVVFSDPQWLFNQLTKVIEFKYNPSYVAEESIKKGVFKKTFLCEVYDKNFDSKGVLKYEDFLSLFVHLNIMARLSDVPEQYFMPALLDPAPTDMSVDKTFGTKVFSTLYIRFKGGFIPRGAFCCLVTISIQNNGTWKLQNNMAYKNLVVFQIQSNKEYLILFDKINYIVVEIYHNEDNLINNHQVLCCTLYESLKKVCSKIHLNGDFEFGFLCEICQSSENFAGVQVQQPCFPESLLCDCGYNPKMTYDQLVWFIPTKITDILNTKRPRQLIISDLDMLTSTRSKKRRIDETAIPSATMTQVVLIPIGHKEEVKGDGKHGGSYQWKGHDFTIILPPDCTDEIVTFTLEAYLPCSTQEHCLVSAVFDITADVTKFKKPVTVRFPHWINVNSKSSKNLHFLVCHNDSYEMKKGYFEDKKSIGSIKLSKFSIIGICKSLLTATFSYVKLFTNPSTHQITTLIQSQNTVAMSLDIEEKITNDATSEAVNNNYLDLLLLPKDPDQNWRIYCIAVDNPTYLQAVIEYFTKEDWITPSVEVLIRKVVFDTPTEDAVAEICVVDKFADGKIIKLVQDKKIPKKTVDSLGLKVVKNTGNSFNTLNVNDKEHEINFPMCFIHIKGELSTSSSKLKIHGLCGLGHKSSEFSLASPTEYGYKFDIYQHIQPHIEDITKTFDCLGMAQKLKENLVSLVNLSYDNMRIYLYSKGVITDTEEMEIAGMNNNNQRQMEKVIKIIRDSLLNKHAKKFKCFLESMEECSDELLKETARRYGGSKSVPDSVLYL